MARVRMKQHVSGGRQVDLENGTWAEWPHRGEILECSDQEAAELVRADLAEHVAEVPVPAATPAPPARPEPAADDATREPEKAVQARTAPRPRAAKSGAISS